MLTPAIRATCRSLLVTQEKRERRPGPSPRRSSRFVLRALSRKRSVIGIVAGPSTTETPIYERKRAGARPCPARVRTHNAPRLCRGTPEESMKTPRGAIPQALAPLRRFPRRRHLARRIGGDRDGLA